MSIKFTRLCWPARILGPPKVTLMRLADFADDAGLCWPSIDRVADEGGISARTAQTAVQYLQHIGVLILVTKGGGRGRPTKYRIDLERVRQLHPISAGNGAAETVYEPHPLPETVQDTHEKGAADAGKGAAPAPELSIEQSKERPRIAKTRKRACAAISIDWQPDQQDRGHAAERFATWAQRTGLPSPDVDVEAERFRNHHLAKGSTMADWHAAWRTWCGNACTFAERRGRPNGASAGPPVIDEHGNIIIDSNNGGAHERHRQDRKLTAHETFLAGFGAAMAKRSD